MATHELVYRNEESGCWHQDEASASVLVTDTTLAELRDTVLASRAVRSFTPALLGITAASVDENRALVIDVLERWAQRTNRPFYDDMLARAEAKLTFDYVQDVVVHRMERFDDSTEKTLLEVTLPGEPRITLSTQHLAAFMLPWTVRVGKKSWETYSTALPLALSKVLPERIPSHGLLDGRRYWSEGFWSDEFAWFRTSRALQGGEDAQ